MDPAADDSTDLGPWRPADPAERAVADAVRGALGQPRPSPGMLSAVQRRATRRHRRRLAGATTVSALAVAGVVSLVPLGVLPTGGRDVSAGPAAPGPEEGAAPSLEQEAAPPPEPKGPTGPLTAASMLTLDQVRSVVPEAQVSEEPGPVMAMAIEPPPPVVGGLCVEQQLPGVPQPGSHYVGAWADGPVSESESVNPDSVRQELLRWDDQMLARTYFDAVSATAARCTDPAAPPEGTGPYELPTPPPELGPEAVVAVAALTPGQWNVRVVATEGTTALSLTVQVASPDAETAAARTADLAAVALEQAVRR